MSANDKGNEEIEDCPELDEDYFALVGNFQKNIKFQFLLFSSSFVI